MGIGSTKGHEVNHRDRDHDHDPDPDRKFKDLEKRIDHGSCFAQTVLRNATQVKRLRQDRLHGWARIGKKVYLSGSGLKTVYSKARFQTLLPCVMDGNVYFLKTAFPSRKLTKQYK